MMKRKLYALLLAGAMALSLAACGTNAASPSGNGTDNSAGVSQPLAIAPAAEIAAALLDTPAAAEFAAHLPLSFHMTDYANREKHAHMDFSIDDSLLVS